MYRNVADLFPLFYLYAAFGDVYLSYMTSRVKSDEFSRRQMHGTAGSYTFYFAGWVNPLSMHVYSLSRVPRIASYRISLDWVRLMQIYLSKVMILIAWMTLSRPLLHMNIAQNRGQFRAKPRQIQHGFCAESTYFRIASNSFISRITDIVLPVDSCQISSTCIGLEEIDKGEPYELYTSLQGHGVAVFQ